MPLNDVTIEASTGAHRQFKIDERSWFKAGQGSAKPGFLRQVSAEGFLSDIYCSQANATDRDAVAQFQFRQEICESNDHSTFLAGDFDRSYVPYFFNDACEH